VVTFEGATKGMHGLDRLSSPKFGIDADINYKRLEKSYHY